MANLPGDTIAIIIPRFDIFDMNALTVLQENTAGIVPIQMLVLRPVSIENKVADFQIVNMFAS
jgi:hypothetical protein